MRILLLSVLALSVGLGATMARAEDMAAQANATKRAAIATMYTKYRKSFPYTPGITAEQLAELQQSSPPVLVDVRDAAERQVSIIPGAISTEAFEKNRERYKGKKIVTYCTIGYRSGLYAGRLRKKGFNAVNLAGSILSWTHAGKTVINENGPTNAVHVYGKKWDLAADGYMTTWYGVDKKRKTK